MVAIPWVSWLVLPFSLLALAVSACLPAVGAWLFVAVSFVLQPLWWLLQWVAQWPHAVWQHALPSLTSCLILLCGMSLLLLPPGIPGRALGAVLLLPLFFSTRLAPARGGVWLTVLDVGQGLAAVVQTAHHTLLYDAGPHTFGGFDAGQAVVLPYLTYLNRRHLDIMMISHADNDHIGGAKAILDTIPVDQVITSLPAKLARWHPTVCQQGQRWQWDGVHFEVLWPPAGMPYSGNNSSCVLRVQASHQALLLTGDIEHAVEAALVRQQPAQLAAAVLVAPHHGSATSSSAAFITAVAPRWVVYPTGFLNRYHFPAAAVVARYAQAGASQYATSWQGAVEVSLLPQGGVVLGALVNR